MNAPPGAGTGLLPTSLPPTLPHGVAAATPGTATVPPRRYEIPKIHGDPDGIHRLAGEYRELADVIAAQARQAGGIVAALGTAWAGPAERSIDRPLTHLLHNAQLLVKALDEGAADLDKYAAKLAISQHHHHFSLAKLAKVAGVVVVGVTAIVVTMGAASVVEAAAATALVTEATEATAAVTVAESAVAGELLSWTSVLRALAPLLRFVLPRLVPAELSMGGVAAYDEGTEGRLDCGGIARAGGFGFLGATLTRPIVGAIEGAGWLAASPGVVRAVAPAAADGLVWTGTDALSQELETGRIRLLDLGETFVITGGGPALHDEMLERRIIFRPGKDYYRLALRDGLHRAGRIADRDVAHDMALLRHTDDEISNGEIDLLVNENRGHVITRHVGKAGSDLARRIRVEHLPNASSFFSRAEAERYINHVLAANRDQVRRWLTSAEPMLRLRTHFAEPVGMTLRNGRPIRTVHNVLVVLARDGRGAYVLTSYPYGK